MHGCLDRDCVANQRAPTLAMTLIDTLSQEAGQICSPRDMIE